MNKHPNHSKQLPQILIVGDVSENFSSAFEELLKLESQGEVEIIYQDIEDQMIQGKDWGITIVNEISKHTPEVSIDSLSMLTYNTTTEKIHKHPHWHKGRW